MELGFYIAQVKREIEKAGLMDDTDQGMVLAAAVELHKADTLAAAIKGAGTRTGDAIASKIEQLFGKLYEGTYTDSGLRDLISSLEKRARRA